MMRNNIQDVAAPLCLFEQVYRTNCGIGRELQNAQGKIVGKIEDAVEVAPALGQIVKLGSRRFTKYFIRRT